MARRENEAMHVTYLIERKREKKKDKENQTLYRSEIKDIKSITMPYNSHCYNVHHKYKRKTIW